MKKILQIVFIVIIIFSLVSITACSNQTSDMTIGYVQNEYSACIAPLLEYNRDNYYFIKFDTTDELKNSLKNNEIDCSFMSYYDSIELEKNGFCPKAALAKLNAFICGKNKEKISDVKELDGNELLIPKSFLSTYEYNMLEYIISVLNISVTEKAVDDDVFFSFIQSDNNSCYMIIPYKADFISCFYLDSVQKEFLLTDLWNSYISKDEPVSYVIVADEQYLKSDEYLLNLFNNFLFECDDSVSYVNNHTQKSAVLCIDLGLTNDFITAKKIITSGSFGYYDGNKLNKMIDSNKLLLKNEYEDIENG